MRPGSLSDPGQPQKSDRTVRGLGCPSGTVQLLLAQSLRLKEEEEQQQQRRQVEEQAKKARRPPRCFTGRIWMLPAAEVLIHRARHCEGHVRPCSGG